MPNVADSARSEVVESSIAVARTQDPLLALAPARRTHRSLLLLFAVLAGASSASASRVPQPVSPGAELPGAIAEARCPTFSWAAVPGAAAYEIAVYRVAGAAGDGASGEPVLVLRANVPGGAQSYTPPVGRCLERGQHYGWSVAAVERGREVEDSGSASRDDRGALVWSPAFLFEVEAELSAQEPPSSQEVAHAVETLERYLAAQRLPAPTGDVPRSVATTGDRATAWDPATQRAPATAERPRVDTDRQHVGALPAAPMVVPAIGGVVRQTAAASTPLQGDASLSVSGQLHLAAGSDLFKDDQVFLWDDVSNLALGRNALASVNGIASSNTAVGRYAMFHNTTGRQNSAFGTEALRDNISGLYNTANGVAALASNTTGSRNTASGNSALRANTTADDNTAIGALALLTNTTGHQNTASGHGALQGNTTGNRNTASGHEALHFNTTGGYNTATGSEALYANGIGRFNTAMGDGALRANSTGDSNTATGNSALRANTSGDYNTATGLSALSANTTGEENTAVGVRALEDNTGSGNTALGHLAGANNTTGNDSIFINNLGAAGDTRTIKIGASGTQLTTFIAGIRNITTIANNAIPVLISSTGQLGTISSSRELKRDIRELGNVADRLLDLHPVAFRFRQHVERDPETPFEYGLIAEEVAEVFPELVVFDENGRPQTVKYHLLSSLLLGALQEQRAALEHLERVAAEQRAWLDRNQRLAAAQGAELRRLARAIERRAPAAHGGAARN